MAEWKIVVKDRYPAYIDWESFERIQVMLRDNYAEYNRKQTRGVPRDGAALLQGIVWCGQCGRKMSVQYKGRNGYNCRSLHRRHGAPICQVLPADPIDAGVVAAFFAAVTPAELDAWKHAHEARGRADEALDRAEAQQIERLRYQAMLAERQFNKVDPDNRLVAGELEHRWEIALRELRQAEAALVRHRATRAEPESLSAEDREDFLALGPQLPVLWQRPEMTGARKKAMLRSLIDKVVLRRVSADRINVRIIWRGGEVSELVVEQAVNGLQALSRGAEMEARLLELARQGIDDVAIADLLTREGYRSPRCLHVPVATVRTIRQRCRVLRQKDQPVHFPGWLTITELAKKLQVSHNWVHRQISNGTITIARDPEAHRYLFPDNDDTIALLTELKARKIRYISFEQYSDKGGHQHD
jgi:recombinase-like zinc beta ribbon protein